jgi:hypothetical protein
MNPIEAPRRRLLQFTAGLLAAAMLAPLAAQPQADRSGGYSLLRWENLVPKGWDPTKAIKGQNGGNLAALNDGDPKAMELLRQLREAWDNAPTDPALDGSRIKLPGYLVPLEESAAGHTEFLLVPYFGACIHTPPPPANQIVLVVPAQPAAGYRSMDTVWVSGTLKAQRGSSAMGASGYRLEGALVERYKATPR